MQLHLTLLIIGSLFLLGLLCDEIGRRTRLPRVTLLLGCGIAAGGSGFDLLPVEAAQWYEFLAVSALTMVVFLLGGSLTKSNIEIHGRAILTISASIILTTLVVIGAGLWMMGAELSLALLLSAIASATAPASTEDVIRQSKESGRFVKP